MSDTSTRPDPVHDESHHSLLVEPSRQSPAQRAINTVVRSREFSILLVLVLVEALGPRPTHRSAGEVGGVTEPLEPAGDEHG